MTKNSNPTRKPGELISAPEGDGRYSSNGRYVYVCPCGHGTRIVTVSGRDDDWIGYSESAWETKTEVLDCDYCRSRKGADLLPPGNEKGRYLVTSR